MWQPVFMISGFFISLLGFAMLIPASIDIFLEHHPWSPFLSSSIIVLFLGLSLFFANKTKINRFSIQQGFLLTSISWTSVAFLSSLPFIFSNAFPSFVDSFFEAFSGITATGASVIADIENLPKSVLLWRSMLNGLGGIGIVIFAIAVMPLLGVGGMQIFQRENSDFGEQFMPKMGDIAQRIIYVYLAMFIGCSISFYFGGMSIFDAINHSLTTISTGGFSTKNNSFAFFNSPTIEFIAIIFMILGSLPMSYYLLMFYNNKNKSLKVAQIKLFLQLVVFYVAIVFSMLVINETYNYKEALRHSAFNVISIMTTTGFSSLNYMNWGNFAAVLFMVFALTGGCTGSTTGSVKIFRWQALIAYLKNTLTRSSNPNLISQPKTQGITINDSIINSVLTMISFYMLTLLTVIILLSLNGLPFDVAISGSIACFTNTGPGIGDLIGPIGNYSTISDFAKYVLSIAMLLGRLEVVTILVVLSPSFWKN
ncbi:MAG: TrkH family potassium uptake protein [Alphaproteobacteria bacterium]